VVYEEKASDGQSVDITCNMIAEDDQTLNKEADKLYEEDGIDEGTVNIEELVQASEEVLPIVPVEIEVSLPHTNMVDALRILQGYGTGSQSSTETPQVHITGDGMQVDQEDERSNGSAQLKTKTSKSVSFSDQGQVTPVARRPVTRSMSPVKSPFHKEDVKNTSPSPRRLTRFATAEARANASLTKLCNSPSSSSKSFRNMSKNLSVELENAETPESEHQRKVRELAEDCPSFDLGFSPGKKTVVQHTVPELTVRELTVSEQTETSHVQQVETVQKEQDSQVDEVIVISSNDSGDSLDKIFASIEMPISGGKAINLQNSSVVSPTTPGSSTPIPQTKRILKLGPQQKSPFVANDKKPSVPKSDTELYNKVCMYGGRNRDKLNEERIIDYGSFFVELRDLSDSVKPGGWLSNTTCEIALQVLSAEMAKQKKFIMPLMIAVSKIIFSLKMFSSMHFPGYVFFCSL
jgi:hypothetical protein